ncbi:MAG TPA: PAS domain-containing protein [Tepidisphaeraceae bacterium]|jgi:PAS domain S-box-containing protein
MVTMASASIGLSFFQRLISLSIDSAAAIAAGHLIIRRQKFLPSFNLPYRWNSMTFTDSNDRSNTESVCNETTHELRELRAKLAATEAELTKTRTALDHLAGGVIIADANGNLLDWNAAALRMHGFNSLEEVRRHVADFQKILVFSLQPGGPPLPLEEWPLSKIIRGETVHNYELCVRRTDTGREYAISYSGSVVREPDGAHKLIVLTLNDITEARKMQSRLMDKQRLLRTLVDEIDGPVYIKDATGKFMFINKAGAKLAGRSPEECMGLDATEIFGPDIGKLVRGSDKLVMEADHAFTYEETTQIDGEERHYQVTKCRWLNADGRVGGVFGISRDITGTKLAEQNLRDGEQHVREVMDSLSQIVLVLSSAGRVREMNRTARRTFEALGFPTETIVGQLFAALPWFGAERDTRLQLTNAVVRTATGQAVDLPNVTISYGPHSATYDFSLSPMRDHDGKIGHLILSAMDVTERKLAEQRARDQQAELAHLERVQTMGHIASGLAHELNQPLGAIVNYAGACRQLIAAGRGAVPQFDEVFASVITEAIRAGEIIRRLRTFVKKQRPQTADTDPNLLVQDSLRILAFEARQERVIVHEKLAADLPAVQADSIQITQVLVNLIRNAIDAMGSIKPSDRCVTVTTNPAPENSVCISVADTGTGVPAENIPRLFDAFYTTKQNGLGIGLALCRMIVENHGGQIYAEPNPGGGMVFSFTLRSGAGITGKG